MLDFIGKRKIFYVVSLIIALVSLAAIIIFGFRWGIDFKGGTRWQIDFTGERPGASELLKVLKENNINDAILDFSGKKSVILRFKDISEEEHQKILSALISRFGQIEEKNFSSIGPIIGAELKRRALWAVFIVTLMILAYVSYAFRKASVRIPSYKYGTLAIVALIHDVIAMLGFFSLLGHFTLVELNSYFIVALLIVMGYSVHDTIVVFDRIRENMKTASLKSDVKTITNDSINQTLSRSINTSLTSILALLGLYFFGPLAINTLVLAMMFGIFIGTYSSIFIASPLLVDWSERRRK